MKKVFQKSLAMLCMVCVLAALFPVFAASPSQKVKVPVWDGYFLYVDGTWLHLVTNDHPLSEPVTYQGSVYIPLHTVEELLGAQADWQEKTATLSLTRGGQPYVRNLSDDLKALSKEERAANYAITQDGWKNGIDATLRTDVTLLVDGKSYSCVSAQGTAVHPLFLRNEFYLPIRSVADLAGKQITWLSGQPYLFKPLEVLDFNALYRPYQPRGCLSTIHIYDRPSQKDLNEAQAFLNQAQTLYEASRDATAAFPDPATCTVAEAYHQLKVIGGYAEQLRTAKVPDAAFFRQAAKMIHLYAWDVNGYRVEGYLANLDAGCTDLSQMFNASLFKDSSMLSSFYDLRDSIEEGQRLVNAVTAQTNGTNF